MRAGYDIFLNHYDLFKYLDKYFQSTFIPVAIERTKNDTKRLKFFAVKMRIHNKLQGFNVSIQTL